MFKLFLNAFWLTTSVFCVGIFPAHAQYQHSSVEVYTLEEAFPGFETKEKTQFYEASAGYRPYQVVADKAVLALIEGKDDVFFEMTSRNLIAHFKKEKVQKNIKESLLPFFQDFGVFNEDIDVSQTTDHWESQGYSFYQSFKTTSGETKHFLVQVVVEDGNMVIANLSPDARTPYDIE